jgi:hypothetical protein
MDRTPNHPANGDAPANAPAVTAAVSPVESGWEEYYREASRRRRRNGGGEQLRIEKRRRRIRERLGFALSALLVAGLTGIFYLVLR